MDWYSNLRFTYVQHHVVIEQSSPCLSKISLDWKPQPLFSPAPRRNTEILTISYCKDRNHENSGPPIRQVLTVTRRSGIALVGD